MDEITSTLRKLPSNLNRKQLLFFDGIRYSIEMADVGYTRLIEELHLLYKHKQSSKFPPRLFAAAFSDAWMIVDNIYRLRTLISHLPKLKKNLAPVQNFLRQTAGVNDLRNSIQHLNTQIEEILSLNIPALGVLAWVYIPDPNAKEFVVCQMVAGTVISGEHPLVNFNRRSVLPPIDMVELRAGGYEICLSDLISNMHQFVLWIEKAMEKDIDPNKAAGGDILICVELGFDEEK